MLELLRAWLLAHIAGVDQVVDDQEPLPRAAAEVAEAKLKALGDGAKLARQRFG